MEDYREEIGPKEYDVFDMITQQIKVFELEFIKLLAQEGTLRN